MTDDLERDLREMLDARVANLPDAYDAPAELLQRAHRRRAVKFGAIGIAALVVIVGTAGVVVQSSARSDSNTVRVAKPDASDASTSTSVATRPSVATVACPITYALTGSELPAPSTAARIPTVGDPTLLADMNSYAATTDPRYVALGPKGWVCHTTVAADGQNGMGIAPPGAAPDSPTSSDAPSIQIANDFLWHGGVGSLLACSVFADPALMTYLNQNSPEQLPCSKAGRTVTRVDAHVSTFVDSDGARGAGWIMLPTSPTGPDDGKLGILTCRPGPGLTAADCDAIIADFVARNSAVEITPPTTTSASTTTTTIAHSIGVAPTALPPIRTGMIPGSSVATTNGIVIADYLGHIEFYDTTADSWQTMPRPPVDLSPWLLASRGDKVFVVLGINGQQPSETQFAMLDVGTGRWTALAALPDDLYTALTYSSAAGPAPLASTGDADRIFVFSGVNKWGNTVGNSREISFEYDIAANRWTKLPRSPLSFRKGSALQWTGRELLVWGGADYQTVGAESVGDGAAYDPATRTWRTLPPAPMHASAGAASVWTGSQMLVWGGSKHPFTGSDSEVGEGAAYDPTTNAWTKIAPSPLPATTVPAAVWTGHEMLLFTSTAQQTTDVAAYDPTTDRWQSLPLAPDSVRALFGFGNQAEYGSWIGGEAIFGVVNPGGQYAAFRF